jgi:hydroxyethylthiazole kinase-like uncharacterized protein yjeF
MKILTAAEMGAADRRSVEAGVPVRALMQNAGEAVARFCLRRFPAGDGLVVVLAGKGNNGGDGMVAAAALAQVGRKVRVVLLGKASDLKGEAAEAFAAVTHLSDDNAVAKMGPPVCDVREISDADALRDALRDAALVIDAVVGTGFNPPLRALAAAARDLLAGMRVPVVAVDLPSGWDADSIEETGGEGDAAAFRADAVITFAAPKLAHVFGHLTTETFGPVVVAPIGTPEAAIESDAKLHWAGAAKAATEAPRDVNGNKGKFGHVLIVGGAWGKAGAPSMSSLAAMRAGAGLVTAAVPGEILAIVAAVAPELMLQGLEAGQQGPGKSGGGLSLEQLEGEKLAKLLKGITVVGIGPGLGQEGSTPEFVRRFVERVALPMVIDADALNALAGRTALLHEAVQTAKAKGKPRTIVLTPADRIGLARSFATEHGVTLVLKGWRTLVAHPDGRVAVNTTGNPSMAKGGSGDILTGIVAAMLAQYGGDPASKEKGSVLKPENVASAVEAAVFLHGLAGDFACVAQDEHTVLATDTVDHLWRAFRVRVTDEDGLTWVAGLVAAGLAAR